MISAILHRQNGYSHPRRQRNRTKAEKTQPAFIIICLVIEQDLVYLHSWKGPLMKTDIRRRLLLVILVSAALLPFPRGARAQVASAKLSKTIAAALQPFVDNHSLAGAVTLVADKDKVLSLEAVGFADVAAGKLIANRRVVLDRLAVKTDDCNRTDDARGRRQGQARRPRGKVPAGVQ